MLTIFGLGVKESNVDTYWLHIVTVPLEQPYKPLMTCLSQRTKLLDRPSPLKQTITQLLPQSKNPSSTPTISFTVTKLSRSFPNLFFKKLENLDDTEFLRNYLWTFNFGSLCNFAILCFLKQDLTRIFKLHLSWTINYFMDPFNYII